MKYDFFGLLVQIVVAHLQPKILDKKIVLLLFYFTMKNKFIFIVALISIFFNSVHAQTDSTTSSFSADLNVDIVNRRMWRGFKSSNSPEFQPTIDLAYNNLYMGIWGAYTFSDAPMQEIDIWLGYSYKNFSFTLYDYWNPSDTLGWKSDLFEFDPKKTNHLSECVLTYDGAKFPIHVLAGILIYGYDRDQNGNNNYSTYFELGYTFENKGVKIQPFAGFSPTKNGFYCESFNFVNVGLTVSKDFKITENYSIPTKCSLVINPEQETMNLILRMSIL